MTAPRGRAALPQGVQYVETIPFGPSLAIERYRLENGLSLLLLEDRSAPVVSYHTWFRVGSKDEIPGKTGLAHLLEHLMFVEFEGLPRGAFDKKMERIGADNNASTWLDFTQYQEAFPKKHLAQVIRLEATRMSKLLLQKEQVESEIEVVKNERRYRVDDDVEGTMEELLWKTAFQKHPYHWPTIGWMPDIAGFAPEDCAAFYRSYYAPNNASLVLVGDFDKKDVLRRLAAAYGPLARTPLPARTAEPEPPQTEKRLVEVKLPTASEKLSLGFKGPALGDPDHVACTVLIEILAGGRSSRLFRALVTETGLCSEVRGSVGPHRDPSLIEFFFSVRQARTIEELTPLFERELETLRTQTVSLAELERAVARAELGLLGSLETADGKASVIGFYECVEGKPESAFSRLEAMRAITAEDVRAAAGRYLRPEASTWIIARPDSAAASDDVAIAEAS